MKDTLTIELKKCEIKYATKKINKTPTINFLWRNAKKLSRALTPEKTSQYGCSPRTKVPAFSVAYRVYNRIETTAGWDTNKGK